MKLLCSIMSIMLSIILVQVQPTLSDKSNLKVNQTEAEIYQERLKLYSKMEKLTSMNWKWIAAIDQYERTLTRAKPKYRKTEGHTTQIYIEKAIWSGRLNPNHEEYNPDLITLFDGIGRDGDGDGRADWNNDEDLLASLLYQVKRHGTDDENIKIGLWDYYQNARAVDRINQFHKLYNHFGRIDLGKHAFPLPNQASYSYRSTWGDGRGWGGKRIHEGTDIFAPYGTDVRSTCYGIIEVLGWNKYGGWRIGIRDLDNHYHYFAHLQGFNKALSVNHVVQPGEVIGWVGSSGYGKPGTSGKFPPHLHYGIYSDRGYVEWAFDPYPSLRKWEKQGK